MIFLDTCILIDHSKQLVDIDWEKECCIDSIVSMEFKVGALNKKEMMKIKKILANCYLLETDQSIFDLSEKLIEKYTLSHNLALYDAIIAATCLVYDLPLVTYNQKDFRFISDLHLLPVSEIVR